MKKTIAAVASAVVMLIGARASFADEALIQNSQVDLGVNAAQHGVGYQAGFGINFGSASQYQSALSFTGPVLPYGAHAGNISLNNIGENAAGGSIGSTFGGSINGSTSAGLVNTAQLLMTF